MHEMRPVMRETIEVIFEPITAGVSIKHKNISFNRVKIIKEYMKQHGWEDCTKSTLATAYTYSKKFTDVDTMQKELEDIKLLFTFDEYTSIYCI